MPPGLQLGAELVLVGYHKDEAKPLLIIKTQPGQTTSIHSQFLTNEAILYKVLKIKMNAFIIDS